MAYVSVDTSAVILEDMKKDVKKLMAYRYQHGYDRVDFDLCWIDITDRFNQLTPADQDRFNEYCI